MPDRESIEKRLTDVRRRRDEAEASAQKAADDLVREAALGRPLDGVDPDVIRALADTYADAVVRLRCLDDERRGLMDLLM